MNVDGVIRTYNTETRAQNDSMSFDLKLCADYQAMAFLSDGTLLTLIKELPVALAWNISVYAPDADLPVPVKRVPGKDVELYEDFDWTGIDVLGDDVVACHRAFLTFKRFERE